MKYLKYLMVVLFVMLFTSCVKEINIYYTINTTINANGVDSNLLRKLPLDTNLLRKYPLKGSVKTP